MYIRTSKEWCWLISIYHKTSDKFSLTSMAESCIHQQIHEAKGTGEAVLVQLAFHGNYQELRQQIVIYAMDSLPLLHQKMGINSCSTLD